MAKEMIECIALVCVQAKMEETEKIEHLERRQEKLIREYSKRNGIKVVDVIRCRGLGQMYINQKFNDAVALIQHRKVQGLIAIDMQSIASNLADAYLKVGKVRSAGGVMVTINEGSLKLNIRSNIYGK